MSSRTYTPQTTSTRPSLADPSCYVDTREDRYASALQSLSHVLLLTPQNPFYVLQAAETAYTAEDIPLALRFFLMAIDMVEDHNDDVVPRPPLNDFTLRAWYGVDLVSRPSSRATTLFTNMLNQKLLASFLSSGFFLVGGAPRGRTDVGPFLSVKDTRARTLVAAAAAGAGRDQVGALWPRRRIRSVPEMAKSEIVDPRAPRCRGLVAMLFGYAPHAHAGSYYLRTSCWYKNKLIATSQLHTLPVRR